MNWVNVSKASLTVSEMAGVLLVVLIGTFLQHGTCFRDNDVHDVVGDTIADHPVIKQLISRVGVLEKKEKINTELIEKLTVELEKYKNAFGEFQNSATEELLTPEEETGNGSNDSIYSDQKEKRQSSEMEGSNVKPTKGRSVERIRQVSAGDTVAFFATATSSNAYGINQNVIFDSVPTNIGNGYNAHHGIFIAPISGTYVFHSSILSGQNVEVWFHFEVNGKHVSNIYARGTDNRHDAGSQMIVMALQQGDDVSVQGDAEHENIYGNHYTTFSGFLLSSNSFTEVVG